ncbi:MULTISPECIES: ABC transporter permease [Primorskyibacter]|uniref:Peptide/nickel transport system permease protein n=1 Tax=Primorskyibacter flagellatus TaxID=1387277 RepID=A0A1W2EL24_9RHOB|nr:MULTISPECIES: ABC transporter permease [Primorskyibacter]SMD10345.1 peptide/nickel transport system permease protein [Primorskyibacter flagellatus]
MTAIDMNPTELSRLQLARRVFHGNRLASISLKLFALLIALAVFAEFIAPYSPQERNRAYSDGAPMGITFVNEEGRLQPWPLVPARITSRDPVTLKRVVRTDDTERWNLKFFVRGSNYELLGLFQSDLHLFGVSGDGYLHLFGTDRLGRDIFSRTLFAFRTSLSIGVAAVLTAFVLGVAIGGMAGYLRGWFDTVIMRIIEFIQSIPTLPLWLTVAAAVPRDWTAMQVYLVMTVILALIGWTTLARRVRSRVISMHTDEHVLAGKLAGCSSTRLFLRHMLPAFTGYLIVDLTLAFSTIMIAETSLSFLGLGLREPVVSLGVMLLPAQSISAIMLTPWYLIPGLFVVVVVLLLNFIGDGVRDAADPANY